MSALQRCLVRSPPWLLGESNETADSKGQEVYGLSAAQGRMAAQDPGCLK